MEGTKDCIGVGNERERVCRVVQRSTGTFGLGIQGPGGDSQCRLVEMFMGLETLPYSMRRDSNEQKNFEDLHPITAQVELIAIASCLGVDISKCLTDRV